MWGDMTLHEGLFLAVHFSTRTLPYLRFSTSSGNIRCLIKNGYITLRFWIPSASRLLCSTVSRLTRFFWIQVRSPLARAALASRRFASTKPQTLKERLAELIPKEIENVRQPTRMMTQANLPVLSR